MIKSIFWVERKVKETGLTIIPLKIFLNDKGFAKLRIALAKGKKVYDKREELKKNDIRKELDRAMKSPG